MERAGIDFRPSAFLKVQAAIILRMGNRVFFSFHYQDVIEFRANVVRNHWVAKPNRTAAGFYDASLWEDTKKQGKTALKRLINSGVDNTSNTCVLIGSSTYARPWVRYELLKSLSEGIISLASTSTGLEQYLGYRFGYRRQFALISVCMVRRFVASEK
jgi:hypothetical protein